MVQKTHDDAVSYIRAVKETAFHDDKPEIHREFINISHDLQAHRVDQASGIARAEELLKDHPKLLPGLKFFFAKADTAIPLEANRGFGHSQTVPLEPTYGDWLPYTASAQEAFHDDPAKCEKFMKLFNDVTAHRANKIVPPEANRTIPREKRVAMEPTYYDALSYVNALKKAFDDDKPEILHDFTNILHDYKATRVDQASIIARAEELFKDHPELLLGLRNFSAKAKTTIPPAHSRTIPPEANKGFGLDVYISSAREAFHDDPAKYGEFFELFSVVTAHRANKAIPPKANRNIPPKAAKSIPSEADRTIPCGAKGIIPPEAEKTIPSEAKRIIFPKAEKTIPSEAKKIILLEAERIVPPEAEKTIPSEAGKNVHPEAEKTIPPEAEKTILPEAKRIIHLKIKKTIPPEAEKTNPNEAKRIMNPEAEKTIPTKAKRIIHPKAEKTIPPKAKRIIHPKIKKTIPPVAKTTTLSEDIFIPNAKRTIPTDAEYRAAESINNGRKRAEDFAKNLKKRFQSIDTHVAESVQKIMKEYEVGKMSAYKMQEEVVSLLYYHEDLIEQFSRLLPKHLWHRKLSQYYFSETET